MAGHPQDSQGDEPLDYERQVIDPSLPSRGSQLAAGLGCWIFGVGAGLLLLLGLSNVPGIPESAVFGVGIFVVLAEVWLGTFMSRRRRWKSFPIGQLIGAGLTCLLPIGIASVVCGWRL